MTHKFTIAYLIKPINSVTTSSNKFTSNKFTVTYLMKPINNVPTSSTMHDQIMLHWESMNKLKYSTHDIIMSMYYALRPWALIYFYVVIRQHATLNL